MLTQSETTTSVVAGLQSREETARQLGVHTKTISRWEDDGLPVIKVGKLRLHDPAEVRRWILTHQSRPEAPRGRGRPRKAA
jgi:phage terminase Nu1 subunit (DNA packaging protein)